MKSSKTIVVKASELRLWWFPLLVVLVVVVGTPLVILPTINRIVGTNKQLGQMESDLRNAVKKIDQLKAVDEDKINQLSLLFKQALPAQKPYYQALLALQQLRNDTGVSLGDLELNLGLLASDSAGVKAKTDRGGYMTMDTKLRVEGTTEQISEFVTKLQESLPLMKVNNISIDTTSRVGTDNDLRGVNLDLQLVYMLDPPQSKTIGYEPLPLLSDEVDIVSKELEEYFNPMVDEAIIEPSVTDLSRTDIFNF